MKYFHCVIPSNADHPEGKFVTETYIAADSKAEAKYRVAFPAKPVLSGSSATGNQDP